MEDSRSNGHPEHRSGPAAGHRTGDPGIRRAGSESDQLRRELDQYVGALAHDLRAPVRMARLLADRLVATVAGGGDPAPLAEAVESNLEQLEAVIDRLLRLGSLRDSPPQPIEEPLAGIVDDVRAELADDLRTTGASVRCEPDRVVVADPSMIRQLLAAVVENSIRYRDPDRRPVVSISASREGPVDRLLVTDNGLGVPPEHRARVLGLFERLSATSHVPGLGFGLTLGHRIAELHQGRLELVDPAGPVGAAVRVTLPAAPVRYG